MRSRPIMTISLALALTCSGTVAARPAGGQGPHGLQPIPGSFVVTLDNSQRGVIRGHVRAMGARVQHEYGILGNRINVRGLRPGDEVLLASQPGVLSVTPDYVVHGHLADSTALIGADPAPAGSGGGQGMRICVLDSGVNPDHLMFAGNPGRIVAWNDLVNGQPTPYDDNGHGSNVAGVAAGGDFPAGDGRTYHGVAPQASLLIGKVLDAAGSGAFSDVIAGIDWCVTQSADVINMSLGGGAFSDICDSSDPTGAAQAVNQAAAAGVLVVSSAGNERNQNAVGTPACASGAMSVGATYDANVGRISFQGCTDRKTSADKLACFSNKWNFLDVVAPGCITHSATNTSNNTITGICGTSQASPHVAGLAALVMAANPALSASAVRACVNSTALDLGNAGFDSSFGNGRIQAGPAVACAGCVPSQNPESSCADGTDNDCDGFIDCADTDCGGDPACQAPACDNDGICDAGEDCQTCSADCDGKQSGKPANRFCCGNGIAESAEGNGAVCDGNF